MHHYTAALLFVAQTAFSVQRDPANLLFTPSQCISLGCNVLLVVLATIGIIGNIISIIIFSHPLMRCQSINVLFCGLSAIDLIVASLAVITFGLPRIGELCNTVLWFQWPPAVVICSYFLAMSAQCSSVWIRVIISHERFNAVCHPLKGHRLSTRGTIRTILLVILVSLLYNIIRVWEFEIVSDREFGIRGLEPLLKKNSLYMSLYFSGMYILFIFLVPFAALAVLNGQIIRTICRTDRQRREMSPIQTVEHKTTLMMLLVILLFAILNTPPYILNIAESNNPNFYYNTSTEGANNGSNDVIAYHELSFIFMDVANLLVVLNSSISLAIYWSFSQRYKILFKLLLRCKLYRAAYIARPESGYMYRFPGLSSFSAAPRLSHGQIGTSVCFLNSFQFGMTHYSPTSSQHLLSATGTKSLSNTPRQSMAFESDEHTNLLRVTQNGIAGRPRTNSLLDPTFIARSRS